MTAAAESCDRPVAATLSINPVLTTRTRVARVVVSFVLVSIGVGLLISAQLGVAPYDVLNTGVAETFDVRFGVAFLITAATFYGTGIVLGGRTGWASLIGTIVIAPLVEGVLAILPEPEAMAGRVPMFVLGLVVLAAAVCLVITTELGPGPGEVFMLGLIARGIPVARSRWITDGIALALGVAFGGSVGAGTLIFAFAFGPLVAGGLRALHYTPPVHVANAVVAP